MFVIRWRRPCVVLLAVAQVVTSSTAAMSHHRHPSSSSLSPAFSSTTFSYPRAGDLAKDSRWLDERLTQEEEDFHFDWNATTGQGGQLQFDTENENTTDPSAVDDFSLEDFLSSEQEGNSTDGISDTDLWDVDVVDDLRDNRNISTSDDRNSSQDDNINPKPDFRSPERNTSRTWKQHSLDILVAVFFIIAAGWLLLALFYSCMIVTVLRLQARGALDDIYEDDFGRILIWGRRVNLSCLLRRYAIQLEQERMSHQMQQYESPGSEEDANEDAGGWFLNRRRRRRRPPPIRIMTRSERRQALERLLHPRHHIVHPCYVDMGDGEDQDGCENDHCCPICLDEYVPQDSILSPPTCQHEFHYDCIMEWLERRNHLECPCCRTKLVQDEALWKTVKTIRAEQAQLLKQRRCRGIDRLFGKAKNGGAQKMSADETTQQHVEACDSARSDDNIGTIPSTSSVHPQMVMDDSSDIELGAEASSEIISGAEYDAVVITSLEQSECADEDNQTAGNANDTSQGNPEE